ncbi:MAG: hypothetical protein P1U81_03725 [Verrucomicrobiales bacterium]|jgi:hypothetical protein|nr:hypothetical protein [bacterium]MDF2375326.1 hypothetical protein [Verrucomicrobiales bacterium]
MRSIVLLALAVTCSFSLSSCGLVAHQVHNARRLLSAPFRVELDIRFIDGIPDLEREVGIAVYS